MKLIYIVPISSSIITTKKKNLGKTGGPDQIVAIFIRRDLDKIASIFKGKYK